MSRVLILVVSLLVGSCFAGDETVTCNGDNSLTITVPYNRPIELVSLDYGSCNRTSDGVRYDQDETSHNITITLQITPCGMDTNLRDLIYDHKAEFVLGAQATDSQVEILIEHFKVDVSCSYITTIQVSFSYGSLEKPVDTIVGSLSNQTAEANTTAAIIDELVFLVKTFTNRSFSVETDNPSSQAGGQIFLGVIPSRPGHNNFNISSLNLSFAPTQCEVVDKNNTDSKVDLYDHASGQCENEVLDLEIGWIEEKNMITIVHTLFLINSKETSNFDLVCTVRICDDTVYANACQSLKDDCTGG